MSGNDERLTEDKSEAIEAMPFQLLRNREMYQILYQFRDHLRTTRLENVVETYITLRRELDRLGTVADAMTAMLLIPLVAEVLRERGVPDVG